MRGPVSQNEYHVYEVELAEKTTLTVKITGEGIIVDTFDGEGVPNGTWARTYDELYEAAQ
jgi:hypothetical protein